MKRQQWATERGGTPATNAQRPARLSPLEISLGTACADIAITVLTTVVAVVHLAPALAEVFAGCSSVALQHLVARVVSTAVIVGMVFLLLVSDGLPAYSIGVTCQRLGAQILAGVYALPLSFGVVALSFGIYWIASGLWPAHESPARPIGGLATLAAGGRVDSLFVLLALGAIQEEIVFRAILLTRLRRIVGRWWLAVVASSTLFAGMHLAGGGGLAWSSFFLSILWSHLYIRSGSLITIVVVHVLLNTTLVLILPRILAPALGP